ncbi:MAG: RluA family pseudouridine synthase [Armatimonadetes bacterium]|nr:RluA family pseudouridine synthase [Armatimonadota bacterium]
MLRLTVDSLDRLDKFLAARFPDHSRSKIAKHIEEGKVLVNGNGEKSSFKLRIGDVVEMEELSETEAHDLTPFAMEIEIVYEDDDMLIVNKPRGLAAHPAASLREPSLVNVLLARGGELSTIGGEFRPGIVHRLDKDTTGLMVVAKNDFAHAALAAMIEKKEAHRRYFAVVAGEVDRDVFTVDAPIARNPANRQQMTVDVHGKRAVTHVKKVARLVQGTLVACRLETGRTHQIRVHLRALGHPVLGDSLYAPKEQSVGPMQLHAAYLAVVQPRTGEPVAAYAMPPEDFSGREFAARDVIEGFE